MHCLFMSKSVVELAIQFSLHLLYDSIFIFNNAAWNRESQFCTLVITPENGCTGTLGSYRKSRLHELNMTCPVFFLCGID